MAQIKSKFIENGAVTDEKVSSGIDAVKIGNGDVSNAELSHVSGVTSGIQTQLDAKIPSSEKGAASGVATLDAGGKIPSSQIPAVAITDVFSVADIAARDALTIGSGDGEIQEGDVVVVTDASADPAIISGAASYIYNGSAYLLLKSGDDVLSVAGKTGVVSLDTDDVSEASNLYYTEARVSANVDVAANTAARHDAVTLGAGEEALALSGQELSTNAATGSTAGHMSAADKTKLDGIEANAKDDQSAAEVPYSNASSGLAATDVQAAVDEVEGRVDALEALPVPASASEVLTLIAGDITAESVSLANSPRNGSVVLSVDGIVQTPGVDYSVSGSSLRFGDAADAGLTSSDLDPTSGAAALVAGDVLVVKYEY